MNEWHAMLPLVQTHVALRRCIALYVLRHCRRNQLLTNRVSGLSGKCRVRAHGISHHWGMIAQQKSKRFQLYTDKIDGQGQTHASMQKQTTQLYVASQQARDSRWLVLVPPQWEMLPAHPP